MGGTSPDLRTARRGTPDTNCETGADQSRNLKSDCRWFWHQLDCNECCVARDIRELLNLAARPDDRHVVNRQGSCAESEMSGSLTLAQEMRPDTDFAHLYGSRHDRLDLDLRAQALEIGSPPDSFDAQPVVDVSAVVSVQDRSRSVIHEKEIEVAVVVVVKDDQPLAVPGICQADER